MRGGARPGSGRPAKVPGEVRLKQSDYLTDNDLRESAQVLRNGLKSDDEKIRVGCAQYIYDQKMGKARQAVDMKHSGGVKIIKENI